MKERERAIKAKDYAKKQREIIKHSSEVKKVVQIQELAPQIQPKRDGIKASDIILEVPEEHNESSVILAKVDQAAETELDAKVILIDQFQRIDQVELKKIGLSEKQNLTEEAIPEVHQYSMLQRFR